MNYSSFLKLSLGLFLFLFSINITIAQDTNKTYKIILKSSGKSLDVSGGSKANGASIIGWSYQGNENQKFKLTDRGNGHYSISMLHSKKVMDANGNSNGAAVTQYQYHGGDNQLFKFISKGNGYYIIKSKSSGRVLDMGPKGLLVWDLHGGDNQLFKLVDVKGNNTNSVGNTPPRSNSVSEPHVPMLTPSSSYKLRLRIKCEREDDGSGSDEEIFGKLTVSVGGKNYTLFHKSEDDHVHIYEGKDYKTKWISLPSNVSGALKFGGTLYEEDTGGDDDLGTQYKTKTMSQLASNLNSEHVTYTDDETIIKVYVNLEKNEIHKKQTYSVSNIKAMFNDISHAKDYDLEGMGDEFYDAYDNEIKEEWATRYNHIQGMAVLPGGQVVLCHDLEGSSKGFIMNSTQTIEQEDTPFQYKRIPSGNHPSAMQNCGDYVAMSVTTKGIYFYKNTVSGLVALPHLTKGIGTNSSGLVFSEKDNCYYLLSTNTADESSDATLKLYKSTKNNLDDTSCSWTHVKDFSGAWGSSMGTHLLIQNDGTLFVVALYSTNNALVTDRLVLSEINSDMNRITEVKKLSNYRGTNVMQTACFRWASAIRIEGNTCYLISAERSFADDYTIKYYKTN